MHSSLSSAGPAPDRQEMTTTHDALPGQTVARTRPLSQWLVTPWVDKTVAILVILLSSYPIAKHFRSYMFVGEVVFLSETLLFIATMIFRSTPVRVSINPWHWSLAFVASSWGFLVLSVEKPGRVLVSARTLLLIYFCSAVMIFWGRLSLGRSIGVVPAQRKLVARGAYRWVRHPIYTAAFLTMIGRTLESYSILNLSLYALGIFWFVARSLAEEEFLHTDPAYSVYMQRVRWRWIPGVI